jgi:hypothetical protein
MIATRGSLPRSKMDDAGPPLPVAASHPVAHDPRMGRRFLLGGAALGQSVPFTPSSENELYWNFAVAEVRSSRYDSLYREHLGPRVAELVRNANVARIQPAEWDRIRRAVRQNREPILRELPAMDLTWLQGELRVEDVASIRVMNTPAFAAYAPSRRIAEFVHKLDERVPLMGDEEFADNYHRLRPRFDPTKVFGRPILLAPRETGPLTELEGLTRLCAYASAWSRSEAVPTSVPVLLGVSPRVHAWSWY